MAYKVFLSPSNQFANAYAYGNTNEGKQMGIVATYLEIALERCGFSVMLMHDYNMTTKCQKANEWGADLYMPLHSNACNKEVAGTHMFCYSTYGEGYKACLSIFNFLAPLTPGSRSEVISARPDLFEVYKPKAPTAYIEVDFHDVKSVAKWIIEHPQDIAEAICKGVCKYFNVAYKAPNSSPSLPMCTVELPILRKGDKNDYVKTMQILLNAKGGFKLTKDGDFGAATEKAFITFQKNSGLSGDGKCGHYSWLALLK